MNPIRLVPLLSGVVVLAACNGATVAPPQTPPPPNAPPIATFPWLKPSVAEGTEMPLPASPPVVIRGATLMLATGRTIPKGTIVLQNGKIVAIAQGDIAAPEGAIVLDGTGKFVTPGIIDTHSHLGVYPAPSASAHLDGNEMVGPVQPSAQVVDAFWPQDPNIERAVAGGVTAMQVLPGSGNLIGGRALTVKMRQGLSGRDMHFRGAPDGLKMACGENPKRVYGMDRRSAPMTRMGNLAGQREAFLSAAKLKREWEKYARDEAKRREKAEKKRVETEEKKAERARQQSVCKADPAATRCAEWAQGWKEPIEPADMGDPMDPPARDPGLETLIAAMEGQVLVHVHCYRADDMLDMLALSDEVGFRVRSFHHALEAYKIRGELARRGGIGVSTWADWWGFKMEAYDGIPENAALVHESGGRAIIHTDSAEGMRRMNQEAAKALASGQQAGVALTEEDAIRWITANPAWALGIDGRTGTLEIGKDADVVLWDRHPFSVYASAEKVFIDGALVHDKLAPKHAWSDFELGQDQSDDTPAAPLAPATAPAQPILPEGLR